MIVGLGLLRTKESCLVNTVDFTLFGFQSRLSELNGEIGLSELEDTYGVFVLSIFA